MKRFICWLLAVIMVFGLVGCSADPKNSSESESVSASVASTGPDIVPESEESPELSIEEILVSEKWKDVSYGMSYQFDNGGEGTYESNGFKFPLKWKLNEGAASPSIAITLAITEEIEEFSLDFVQENDLFLLKNGVSILALESDYEKAVSLYRSETAKEIEYYEECTSLPTVDSCTYAVKSGSSTSTSNGVVTKIEYTYAEANEEILKTYIAYLNENGFSTREADVNSYEIVEDKYIIANIVLDGESIRLNIIPEANREMSLENMQIIKIGDTIETKDYKFTLYNVELTYELKPSNTSGFYTCYPADAGMVYIHIDGQIYNSSKRDFRIKDLFVPHADYNNGFKYDGFVVIDDGDSGFDYVSSYVACSPLASCHYHGLISCPESIDGSTEPLFVSFTLANGITYRYNIR